MKKLAIIAMLILALALSGCRRRSSSRPSYVPTIRHDGPIAKGDKIGPYKISKLRLCSKPYDNYEPMPWAVLVFYAVEPIALECPSPGAMCVGRKWLCDPPGSGENWRPYNAVIPPNMMVRLNSLNNATIWW
jgi:hypothetical protein